MAKTFSGSSVAAISGCLCDQVHAAVASALGDLRQELANAIGDAVKEALRNRPVK